MGRVIKRDIPLRINPKLSVLLAALFLWFFALVTYYAHLDYRRMTWPAARGRVISSDLKRQRNPSARYRIYDHVVSVSYGYSVSGRSYKNLDRLVYKDPEPARQALLAFAPGRDVDLYYDPKDASSSSLVRMTYGRVIAVQGIAVIFLVMAVMTYRKRGQVLGSDVSIEYRNPAAQKLLVILTTAIPVAVGLAGIGCVAYLAYRYFSIKAGY